MISYWYYYCRLQVNQQLALDAKKALMEKLRMTDLIMIIKKGQNYQSLIVIHSQHASGLSVVVLWNFSFLPHILQQQCLISNCFFFIVFKNIFVYVATAAIAPSYKWLIISCLTPLGAGVLFMTNMIYFSASIVDYALYMSCNWHKKVARS